MALNRETNREHLAFQVFPVCFRTWLNSAFETPPSQKKQPLGLHQLLQEFYGSLVFFRDFFQGDNQINIIPEIVEHHLECWEPEFQSAIGLLKYPADKPIHV